MINGEEAVLLEVGPRDGFQNVKVEIPTEDKVKIIDLLVNAGLKRIEVSSFVHPKWIPQLKDAEEVLAKIRKVAGVSYSALIPNEKGLDRAIASGVKEVVYVVSASESTSRKVFNKSTSEALAGLFSLSARAKSYGISLRGTIACCFGCSFEGEIPVEKVIEIGGEFRKAGVSMITLADSMGLAHPRQIKQVISKFLGEVSDLPISVHFHNTRGIGLANVYSAFEAGITIVESSVAGLGGDPLTPEAPGNVATEGVVSMFHKMGIRTGVDLDKLLKCAEIVKETLRRIAGIEYQPRDIRELTSIAHFGK